MPSRTNEIRQGPAGSKNGLSGDQWTECLVPRFNIMSGLEDHDSSVVTKKQSPNGTPVSKLARHAVAAPILVALFAKDTPKSECFVSGAGDDSGAIRTRAQV